MSKKKLQRLELTWIAKGEEVRVEPKILVERPKHNYGDPHTANMLVLGVNLLTIRRTNFQW